MVNEVLLLCNIKSLNMHTTNIKYYTLVFHARGGCSQRKETKQLECEVGKWLTKNEPWLAVYFTWSWNLHIVANSLDLQLNFASLVRCSLLHLHLLSHTWQFIIFTIFTITTFIFSLSLSFSFWTQDLALWQILSITDRFLAYRTDYTDSRKI